VSQSVAADGLFEALAQRLRLSWIAGRQGGSRTIGMDEQRERRPSLVGYLNIIYPNQIQIVGREELNYLDALDPAQRRDTVAKIIAYRPTALLITRDSPVPRDLEQAAEQSATPLWKSPLRGHELLTYLHYHLARELARRTTLHGTLLEVYSIGVLIMGEAGSGKSELALELVTRGHRLIADDAPEFTQIAPDIIDGTCPELLRDLLEVRGLGVLDMRAMYGHTAVKRNKYLRLIIELMPFESYAASDPMQRLTGIAGVRRVLEVDVPLITLPVAPGRNLAVLVEAAVRQHILKSQGLDPAQIFLDRQAHQMRRRSASEFAHTDPGHGD
jgi:HPr kinase/phosphorylase